jgi:glycosyltransferase involved in cell wall biosynthesis
VRILLWHGYLLSGTGSNIYTRALAREWSRAGHEVVVVAQEPHPDQLDLGGAQVVRPELPDRLLPVFVLDRYEGLTPTLLIEWTADERQRYVDANAAALRALLPADLVFANHALMGGPVAAAAGVPHIVKVHGSELEYAIRGHPDLAAWARESLEGAEAVIVGSEHIRNVLHEVVGELANVHEVPPGVDVEKFRPEPRERALAALFQECRRDTPNPGNREERLPYEGNAARLDEFFTQPGPVVVYVGKLLRNKGVHVLFEALRDLDPRGLIVGFGDYREELEAIAPPNVLFTGALEHRHLVHLLPLTDVEVVPSIFPEAFGMVAAEAAAAGVPPLVARHSGLAEVAAGLEERYPRAHRHLAGFESGNADELRAKLEELLGLPEPERRELGRLARETAVERWSWKSVAERLLAFAAE